jgi:hypothetical protein
MRHSFALILIAAISTLLTAAKAPAPSLEGYWKGSGIVSHKGADDRVECRVRYTRAGDKSFSYTATCVRAALPIPAAAAIAERWWVAAKGAVRQVACLSPSAASPYP